MKRLFTLFGIGFSVWDIGIISFFIVMICGSFLVFRVQGRNDGDLIEVKTPYNTQYFSLDEARDISVEGRIGQTSISIKEGRVRVTSSSCPKGFCKAFGWIGKRGLSIVCVPNQVVVRIVGQTTEIDTISY